MSDKNDIRDLPQHEFATLKKVIAELRGPNGCPWDKKQTHKSLKKYLIEEAYEVWEAIDEADDAQLADELGDVLLQVMLHSQIGEDEDRFTVEDVIHTVTAKMIRRHPHVFADVDAETAEDVTKNWEKIKQEENAEKTAQSQLGGTPKDLPAMYRAYHYQKKAAKVGFDWKEQAPVWDKVHEELQEFQEAVIAENTDEAFLEFGDVLFALVNLARFHNIDPEAALQATNRKFYHRFQHIEKRLHEQGKTLEETTLGEMDQLWEEAKKE